MLETQHFIHKVGGNYSSCTCSSSWGAQAKWKRGHIIGATIIHMFRSIHPCFFFPLLIPQMGLLLRIFSIKWRLSWMGCQSLDVINLIIFISKKHLKSFKSLLNFLFLNSNSPSCKPKKKKHFTWHTMKYFKYLQLNSLMVPKVK
jgi:hypothetical protein